jgi:hypothetical protein
LVGRRSVGCSQNSFAARIPALLEDLPQAERGTSHRRLEAVVGDRGNLSRKGDR